MEQHGITDAFLKFSELPTELRLHVWMFACFHERDLDVQAHISKEHNNRVTYSSRSSAPSVLHTCRESRDEGSKWYALVFGVSRVKGRPNLSTPSRIYFNREVDRLCVMNLNYEVLLGGEYTLNVVSKELKNLCDSNRIKSLGLNLHYLVPRDVTFLSSGIGNLEELSIILEPWAYDFKRRGKYDCYANASSGITLVCGMSSDFSSGIEHNPINPYLKEDREKAFKGWYTCIRQYCDPSARTSSKMTTTVHVTKEGWNAYQHALTIKFSK